MATKKPAAKKPAEPTVAEKVAPKATSTLAETQSGDRRVIQAGGIAAEDAEVLRGDIDSRMAALHADHVRMGARPK